MNNRRIRRQLNGCLKLFVLILFFSSCIPTKKVVYLENSESKAGSYATQKWEYKIKSGDRFFIEIADPLANISLGQTISTAGNEQNINIIQQTPTVQDYLVLEDGTMDIPPLGKISAAGKTIPELTSFLKQESKNFMGNPSIKLYMTNYNVTVLGEVKNPGFYQLITDVPNFFDAVGLANDLTDFADRKRVKFIRKDGEKISISYWDITDPDFVSSPYFYLQPNDVIHIMPLKVKKFSSGNALPLFLSVITTIITVISITR